MPNSLAAATSPYLLQHQNNPVDWREWNPATLAEAQAKDRPILLSIGYAACHWCHVMAHESFENETIAALMNRSFVSIKVDREERPDLDAVYQQALAVLGQQGGWPLTMFLTPEGEPFWGGTYFPPEPRFGRASFPQVLEQVAELWRTGRAKIDGNRRQLTDALQRLAAPEPGEEVTAEQGAAVARALAEQFDAIHGGLAGAPKFPQAPILEFVWQAALDQGDATLRQRVLHTLGRICQGGIYDHLGGGFARYAVDAFWLVPHFEKMLYDNAQLLHLLSGAHAATHEPLFAARVAETVDWLRREMLVEGAFASTLDADSEGEEGRFYVWDAAEIDTALGADAAAFKLAYGVTGAGNWEGRNVLNRLHEQGLPAAHETERLARCRELLLQRRERRPRPGRDDKVLADWNGLAIRGLADAAGGLDRRDWLELAAAAFAAVVDRMSDGDRLVHSYRAGRRLELAFLDDYAQMSRAAIALFEQTGDKGYLDRAAAWLAVVDEDYRDADRGGYFQCVAGAAGPLIRPKNAHDGPSPSAVGTLAIVAGQLWHLTGAARYRDRAAEIIRTFSGEARRNPVAHATLLQAAAGLERAVQIVVIGEPETAEFRALHAAAAQAAVPYRVLHPLTPSGALPPDHPAHGKGLVGGRPAAYVCRGMTCEAPVAEAATLTRRLAEAAHT